MKKIFLSLSIFLPVIFFFSMAGIAFASPPAPTNLKATAVTATTVTLSWSASVGATGYLILETDNKVSTRSTTGTVYQIGGLATGTPYQFSVIAYGADRTDTSAQSNYVSVTPAQGVDVTPPSVPSNITADQSSITSSSATINWTASTDETGGSGLAGYNVYASSDATATPINSYILPQNSAAFSSLAAGTSYTRYVRAVDKAGNVSAPGSVTFITLTANTGGTNPGGNVGGTNPPPASGSTSGGFQFNVALNNPLGNNTTDIPSLLKAILNALLEFLAPVIVVLIIWAGFLFVTAQGNPTKITKAKEVLLWTLVGSAIILGANIIATILSTTVTNILSGK